MVDGADPSGFEAWRALHVEYSNVTLEGRGRILAKFVQPTAVDKYSDILQAQVDWESNTEKYWARTC